jgi:hypothetical protein
MTVGSSSALMTASNLDGSFQDVLDELSPQRPSSSVLASVRGASNEERCYMNRWATTEVPKPASGPCGSDRTGSEPTIPQKIGRTILLCLHRVLKMCMITGMDM